jgi:hypothetical protein
MANGETPRGRITAESRREQRSGGRDVAQGTRRERRDRDRGRRGSPDRGNRGVVPRIGRDVDVVQEPVEDQGGFQVDPALRESIRDISEIFLNRGPDGTPRGISFEELSGEQQQELVNQLRRQSGQISELSRGLGGLSGRLGGISERLEPSIGRLGQASEQQLAVGLGEVQDPLEALTRQRTLGSQGEFLSRRGLSGSSAAANQLARTEERLAFNALQNRRASLGIGAQLAGQRAGLLGQQQGIIGQQAGIAGQRAGLVAQQTGLTGQELGVTQAGIQSRNLAQRERLGTLTAGLETMSAIDQLRIAGLAAQNAGAGGDDSDRRTGLFGSFGNK